MQNWFFVFCKSQKILARSTYKIYPRRKEYYKVLLLLIESNNLSVFFYKHQYQKFYYYLHYHLSSLKEHWHKIKWTKQSNKNNTVIEKFNAKRIVSIINVYDKYDNLKFHFLFYPKKLNTNDNKNIMHSYHVSKN